MSGSVRSVYLTMGIYCRSATNRLTRDKARRNGSELLPSCRSGCGAGGTE